MGRVAIRARWRVVCPVNAQTGGKFHDRPPKRGEREPRRNRGILEARAGPLPLGSAGTWSGKQLLNRLPEELFRKALTVVLTVLALRLLYSAWQGAGV